MPDKTPSQQSRDESFMRLFLVHQRRIFSFILTLVPNWHDADDLLQETCTVLWQKFDQFEPGTDFGAWALSVARFRILNYRKQRRVLRERFGSQCFEAIADQAVAFHERRNDNLDALQRCLSALDTGDRELIRLRYQPGATTKSVAEQVGRSVNAVYKLLNRIHRQLLYCVRHKLTTESS